MGHRHSRPAAPGSYRDVDIARRNAMLKHSGHRQNTEMAPLNGGNIYQLTSSSEYHLAPEQPMSLDQPIPLQRLQTEEEEQLAAQITSDYDMALHLQQEEDRGRAAASQASNRDCAVCCESLHPLEFPVRPPSRKCTHRAQVCSSCLQQWVSTKIDANARAAIDCPQCTTLLNHEDVLRACNPETFAKYDKYATLAIVNDLHDFHWCLCVGCTGGQEPVGGVLGYMKCHACNYEQCLHHKTEWHRGESCRQYDVRLRDHAEKNNHDQEERETTEFMNKQRINSAWKKCPKCQVLIEKNDGCDQMKCRVSTMK